ncbi:MAG: Gfo/Idh/MocA family oxidoreductase [Oscillospiraceae bacterium]|nr:Gfo/Idh/MocA family oxidoreductase [Oscillospiraceae bacterium]MBQ4315944.1 Gfo/Idh/MocA family oxidoreductase [Oscillospiraceae bacterium]MBQ6698550.1 Gfo/Idh/MocA family oxidoreductase [Oscillospiraceae bacterium]
MDKVRLGIIGYGNMGNPVTKWVVKDKNCPEIEVTAICDWDEKRIETAKKDYADYDFKYFSDAEEMMKAGVVDAVYIAVPHYDHPVLAQKAFALGIHVMLEKPAGVYTKAIREMNAAAERAGVKFGMMFQQRTRPMYQKAKEILSSGVYGQIRSVNWLITTWFRSQQYYNSGSWRATWAGEGGGVLLNQCPHQLDLLAWLCGMPEEIYAKCSVAQWHDVEIEDDVIATLKYKNGAMGSFITSTGINPGTNRLEIALDKGTMIVENDKVTINELSMSLADYTGINQPPLQITKINYEFPENKAPGHAIMLNSFAGAILRGEEMYAGAEDGLNELTLSNAMYLSSWTDSTIKLPLDEDLFYEELKKRIATSKHKTVEAQTIDASSMF